MTALRTILLGAAMTASLPCAVVPAAAQQAGPAESLQVARQLASAASVGVIAEVAANLSNQAWPGVEAALRRSNPSIDAGTLAELRREFERLQVMAMLDSMSDVALVYERYFTVQEMREIMAFYATPTGAKALRVMPRATAEFIAAMAPRLQGLQAKVHASMLGILEKRGYQVR